MTTPSTKLVQNAPERDEYATALEALMPVLYDLPPKVISIDGRAGVGKTTLGRFLAWRFNITLIETDLFLIRPAGKFEYQIDTIHSIVEQRISEERPVIVEGVVALRLLQEAELKSDFHIHVICEEAEGSSITEDQWSNYKNKYNPCVQANLVLDLPVKP